MRSFLFKLDPATAGVLVKMNILLSSSTAHQSALALRALDTGVYGISIRDEPSFQLRSCRNLFVHLPSSDKILIAQTGFLLFNHSQLPGLSSPGNL